MSIAKLIKTNTYFDNFVALTNALKGKVNSLSGKNLVFCQEKVSLMIERGLCAEFGGTFNTEVYSFGNYLRAKKPMNNALTKEGSAMAVKKILAEVPLVCFNQSKKNLSPSLFDLIMQLKSAKITPQDLQNSLSETKGVLKNKLQDISTVYNAYENFILSENLEDQNSALDYLPKIIEEDQTFSDADVYITGFESFTAQVRQIIFSLLKKARSVTAILTEGSNPFVYVNETTQSFLSLCKDAGVECLIENVESGLTKEGKIISANLFNPSSLKLGKNPTEKIYLNGYANPFDEIESVAVQIKQAVLNGGCRYRDFSVAISDAEGYGEEIKKAFSLLEIPLFIDEKKKVENHPLITLILAYIDLFRLGLDKRNLAVFYKNPLVCKDKNLSDAFELYSLKYNVNYGRIKEPFELDSPDGTDINTLNEFREYICSLIEGFNVRKLLKTLDVEEKIDSVAQTFTEMGEEEQSAINAQVYQSVISILDQIDKLLGGVNMDLTEYKNVFLSGVSALEISIIPQRNDAVFVGNFKEIALAKAKYLFVLGLTSEVPSVKEDVALLSDEDIDSLSRIKVLVEPKIKIINHRTRENVGMGLCAFDKRVYLSYPVSSFSGESLFKSEILTYIEKLFEVKEQTVIREYQYLTKKQGLQSFARSCSDFAEGHLNDFSVATAFYNVSGEEQVKDILARSKKEVKIRLERNREILVKEYASPTYIEDYHRCPYKSFLGRAINLKPTEEGEIDFLSIGILMHEIFRGYLENYSVVNDENSSNALFNKVKEEVLNRKEFISFMKDGANSASVNMALNECRKYCYKFFKGLSFSKFKTDKNHQEIKFGDSKGCLYPSIKLLSGKVKLTGKIDRVDYCDDYFRIIDYKTGKVDSTEKSLFAGVKLQLYLYAKAVNDKKPAGMYYCSVEDSFVDKDKAEKQIFEGVTLQSDKNEDFIGEATEREEGSYAIYGQVVKNALTEQTLNAHVDYAVKISEKAVQRMSEGVIVAFPYGDECKYCQFKGMCQNEKQSRSIGGVDQTVITQSVEEVE